MRYILFMMDKDLNMYVKANTLLRAVHIECLLILKLQKNNDYVDNNNKLCVCVCVCCVVGLRLYSSFGLA